MSNPDTGIARAFGLSDISENKTGSADFDLHIASMAPIPSCVENPDGRSFCKEAYFRATIK
jgi:hypothetical protein